MQTEVISLNQLANILVDATILSTIDRPGLLAHEITHPTVGKAMTVQVDSEVLLIRGL